MNKKISIILFIIILNFIVTNFSFSQSCGSISCPPGYYLSYRCCDAGSCNMNNSDGNPSTGCDGYTNCDSINPYRCCECTPISTTHPCGSCIPSSCPGGVVFSNQQKKYTLEENQNYLLTKQKNQNFFLGFNEKNYNFINFMKNIFDGFANLFIFKSKI